MSRPERLDRAPHAALARARRRARGFTLAELLIAIIAGLLASLGAFILAKNATNFFQQEARISVAQLSANMGLQRLVSDIQRAGFLTSPFLLQDPKRCQQDTQNWPQGLKDLQAIRIEADGAIAAHPSSQKNALAPEILTLAGSFNTPEQFPVRAILANGASYTVILQTGTGPMYRAVKDTAGGGTTDQKLQRIFKAGRFLRIVDTTGNHLYGVIQALQVQGDPPTRVDVTLSNAAPIPQQTGPNSCGYSGFATGMLANPVSRVRYQLRDLRNNPTYMRLVGEIDANTTAVSGDDQRLELTRVELDAAGAEDPTTLELVAEFAVDLRFGVAWQPQPIAPGNFTPTQRVPIIPGPNAVIYQQSQATPQRLREVQVRLVTRARAPDRDNDPFFGIVYADGRKHRHQIDLPGNITKFARTRTLYADVALPNLAQVQW